MRRASWNVMKPRIQCVLAQWIPGFRASGRRPGGVQQQANRHDSHKLAGNTVLVMLV